MSRSSPYSENMHVAAVGQGVGQRLEVAARGGHTTAVQNSVTLVNLTWSLASLIQQAGTSHRRWC
jgi:hypothetical protein